MVDEMKLYPLTAERLKSLMQAKFRSVECEDFEEAKRLKGIIDKLKSAGSQLKELEERKIISVKQEDYDAAKLYKNEIERIRNSIFQTGNANNKESFSNNQIYYQPQQNMQIYQQKQVTPNMPQNYLPPQTSNSQKPYSP